MKTNISKIIRIKYQDVDNRGPGDIESGEPRTIYIEKNTPPTSGDQDDDEESEETEGGSEVDSNGESGSEISDPGEAYSKSKERSKKDLEEDYDYKKDETKVSWGDVLPAGTLGDDPEASKTDLKEKWDEIMQSSMAQSSESDPISSRITKKLQGLKAPVVDWKSELARIIEKMTSSVSYKLPSRRFGSQKTAQYGYKRTKDEVECIVVAIDTSGSISPKMVHRFLSETQSIVSSFDPKDLYVIFCHTSVYRVDHYLPNEKIGDSKIESGGTEFWPPFSWVENNLIEEGIRPAVFIYFTDGYAEFPSPNNYEISEYSDKVVWAVLSFDSHPSPVNIPWGNRLDIILPNKEANI